MYKGRRIPSSQPWPFLQRDKETVYFTTRTSYPLVCFRLRGKGIDSEVTSIDRLNLTLKEAYYLTPNQFSFQLYSFLAIRIYIE